MNRRTVLALCLGLPAWPGLAARPAASAEADLLVGVLRARSSARAVGRRYLAVHREATARSLEQALLAEPALRRALDLGDREGLERAIALLVREDFVARRTVRLDGWVLSRTEAELAALSTFV